MVMPALVNQAIGFLLATSLLAVIGILDILNAAQAATDPNWLGFYKGAFLTTAAISFVIGYGGSSYSLWLEWRMDQHSWLLRGSESRRDPPGASAIAVLRKVPLQQRAMSLPDNL